MGSFTGRKQKRKITEEELQHIEQMFSVDMSIEQISVLLGWSDTWFEQLMKKDNAMQLAKRLGKAKASLKVKTKFWQLIEAGDFRAIKFWLESKEGYSTGQSEVRVGVNSVASRPVGVGADTPQVIISIPSNGREAK